MNSYRELVAMKMPSILLVDNKAEYRALLEKVLVEAVPSVQLLAPPTAIDLGQYLVTEDIQAAIVEADIEWCMAFDLVGKLKSANPDCLVILYSQDGIRTLTPEMASLGLCAFYTKSIEDILKIPGVIKQHLKVDEPALPEIEDAITTEIEQRVELPKVDPGKRENRHSGVDTDVFYALSHDLKQPLQLFKRQLKLLDLKYKSQLDESGKKLIENMESVSDHMEMLLNSLLSEARADESVEGDKIVPLDDVIRSLLVTYESSLKEIGGDVIVGNLPPLDVGRGPMTQLFQNLIDNAIKFRSDQPLVIEINALDVTDNWLFTVKDNGIGIEEEKTDQIFTMFKRLHSQDEYPGSGVGLALCKRIVEQQGGKIWARSKPGQGTSIHFTLPKESSRLNGKQIRSDSSENHAPDQGLIG